MNPLNPSDIVLKFIAAWEAWDIDAMNQYLADEFVIVGPTPIPLDRRWMIADTRVRAAAFPDWKFNLEIVGVTGNVVETVTEVTATHLGMLISPIPGIAPIPATGKQIRQPRERTRFTIRGNKIVQMWVDPEVKGGYPHILRQLGVDI